MPYTASIMSIEENINIIMRQTSYSYDVAKRELEEHDNNYETVIMNALGIKKKEKILESKVDTINQDIYRNIRNFMDSTPTIISNNRGKDRGKDKGNKLAEIREDE